MELSVLEQFKSAVDVLISSKKVKSKKDLALSMGISPSYLTELLKNRINLSAEHIQRFCSIYSVDPRYIFGKSGSVFYNTPTFKYESDADMIVREDDTPSYKSEKLHPKQAEILHPTLHPTPKNCPICIEKERIIASMEITIDALLEANKQLKKRLNDQEEDTRQAG
jgi:transcriptional regulator with XRE-family HTH domain